MVDIDPQELDFENCCEEDMLNQRMLGTLAVSGIFHHVEAIEVVDREGKQVARHPDGQKILDQCREFDSLTDSESYYTVRINERDYVLMMLPFVK